MWCAKKGRSYSLEEILPHIGFNKRQQIELDGDVIRISSNYLQVFKRYGVTCVSCGVAGKYFIKERSNHGNYHLTLVALKIHKGRAKEIRMTRDHILARSKGGTNSLYNQQPMCFPCNNRKGDG